jgi:hypothetical protein
MIFMSDAAVEHSTIMTCWLSKRPSADPTGKAAAWFNQLYPQAYDLVMAHPVVVPSTSFGLLENVLSQLESGIGSRRDLVVGLARGLGMAIGQPKRPGFMSQLMR